MFFLEGEREAVDDGSEDLQQLRHAVVSLRLVDEVVENVVDLLPMEKFWFIKLLINLRPKHFSLKWDEVITEDIFIN